MKIQDLQSGLPLPETPKKPAPLLPLAVGLIAGIVLDAHLALEIWVPLVIFAVGVLLMPIRRRNIKIGLVAVVLAGCSAGMLRAALADRHFAENHIVFYTADEPMIATVEGRIISSPEIVAPPPGIPRPFPLSRKTRFVMQADRLDGIDGPIATTGRVGVTIKEPCPDLQLGDEIRLTGWLFRPRGPQNPGGYDWALHGRREGILAGLSCDHAAGVQVLDHPESQSWQGRLANVRTRLRGYLVDDTFASDDPAGDVISAMVLGQRSGVPKAMNEAFVKTGNAHFLAASGMHVAWLALIGWTVCRLFGLYYRTTAVIVAVLILSYVIVAEPRPSIMRAGIIGVLACATAFFRGRYNSVNALACAAIIILLIRPSDLSSPAFQLSFTATLGLLHFCPHVATGFSRVAMGRGWVFLARAFDPSLYAVSLFDHKPENDSIIAMIGHRAASLVCQLFALAVAEWLLTMPLACYHFNQFVPWGWLGSFTVWFFALPATCIGFITVILSPILPPVRALLSPLLHFFTQAMVGCVDLLTHLPWAILPGRSPSLAWIACVYGGFWLYGYRPKWMPWKHGFKLLAAVMAVWWWASPFLARGSSDALNVWVLAIGNGTATVIDLPNGETWLFDCGTRSNFAAGPVCEAFLKHRNIRRLDRIIVSHPNFDHYGGIPVLADRFDIGCVVLNDHFAELARENDSARGFLETVREAGIPIETTHGRWRFPGTDGVSAETLWPPPVLDRRILDANDTSTVLRLSYQGRTILLTGDNAELSLGSLLADDVVSLKADVLLLPHHGSVTHNTLAFIEEVAPRVTVRSTGQRAALTTNGIDRLMAEREYLSTADVGCVRITITNGEVTAEAVMARPDEHP